MRPSRLTFILLVPVLAAPSYAHPAAPVHAAPSLAGPWAIERAGDDFIIAPRSLATPAAATVGWLGSSVRLDLALTREGQHGSR